MTSSGGRAGGRFFFVGGPALLGAGPETGSGSAGGVTVHNGTLPIEGTGTLAGSDGLLVNIGLVSQVAGVGATAIDGGVNNSGTIAVSSGTLSFAQAVSRAGNFLPAGTATPDFVAGDVRRSMRSRARSSSSTTIPATSA